MYKIIGADHKEYGPISAEQVRQWFSEGRVNALTRVQAEGSGLWKPLSEWPEFASLFPAGPPPSPSPVSPTIPPPVSVAPYSAAPVTNKMAAWSMGVGIFSVLCCMCWPTGIVALILGIVALSQIKADPKQTGQGFAVAGIVTGAVAILFGIVAIIVSVRNPDMTKNLQDLLNQMNNR
jgi:hypothetical protein